MEVAEGALQVSKEKNMKDMQTKLDGDTINLGVNNH
jgi:hypothetical protein